MKIQFDDCTDLDSWVHQWDARFKIIGLVSLMMAFAMVQSLWLLPWMILVVASLYFLSRLPRSFLGQRLRYPGFFLMGIVLFMPWLSGETPLWQWGPLTLWQEGCLTAVLIAGRFLCSVTLGFIVLGTTPFLTLVKAMRSLGMPALLTDMMLLAYRYVFEIFDTFNRMRRAMTLRGFRYHASSHHASAHRAYAHGTPHYRSWHHPLTVLATVTGTLFIRSYEQAERVYQAMRLRGYGCGVGSPSAETYRAPRFSPAATSSVWISQYMWDGMALLLTLLISTSLLLANYWMIHGFHATP